MIGREEENSGYTGGIGIKFEISIGPFLLENC